MIILLFFSMSENRLCGLPDSPVHRFHLKTIMTKFQFCNQPILINIEINHLDMVTKIHHFFPGLTIIFRALNNPIKGATEDELAEPDLWK